MNTPETDKRAWSDHSEGILYEVVEASFARKLERERDKAREDATNYYAKIGELEHERDEAIRQRYETNRSSKYSCDYNYEQKLRAERERDEAREERDLARKEINHYREKNDLLPISWDV